MTSVCAPAHMGHREQAWTPEGGALYRIPGKPGPIEPVVVRRRIRNSQRRSATLLDNHGHQRFYMAPAKSLAGPSRQPRCRPAYRLTPQGDLAAPAVTPSPGLGRWPTQSGQCSNLCARNGVASHPDIARHCLTTLFAITHLKSVATASQDLVTTSGSSSRAWRRGVLEVDYGRGRKVLKSRIRFCPGVPGAGPRPRSGPPYAPYAHPLGQCGRRFWTP